MSRHTAVVRVGCQSGSMSVPSWSVGGGGVRRRWSSATKLAIIGETLMAGSTAQAVAERQEICTSLIYPWRKQMLRAALASFAAVEIKPDAHMAPDHLPRETVVHEPELVCGCGDRSRLARLGEDTTEILEKIPARLKVIRHVRLRYACRVCEAIFQAPAPDRSSGHADAFAGYDALYRSTPGQPSRIQHAACWAKLPKVPHA